MPSGHTDKTTINQRRPLTAGMLQMLATMQNESRVHWTQLSTPEKNSCRALIHRGLAYGSGIPRLTDEGRSVLAKHEAALKRGN